MALPGRLAIRLAADEYVNIPGLGYGDVNLDLGLLSLVSPPPKPPGPTPAQIKGSSTRVTRRSSPTTTTSATSR